MTALVVGEALIDRVTVSGDGQNRTTDHVGGSPANVAVGLSRLGLSVELLAWLARDEAGTRIERELSRAGVRIRDQSWGANATPVAHGVIDDSGAATYTFDLDWDLAVDAALGDIQLVHTGSIASYRQPGADGVLRLVSRARAEGVLVTYDPNVRVDLIDDAERVRRQIQACIAAADVVKLSDDDARWLYGAGASEGAVLDRILASGVSLAAVTSGGNGSALATARARVRVPAEPVTVVDTIGAGDSYMAALIAQVLTVVKAGRQLSELDADSVAGIGRACGHAAAITVSRPGADPPTLAEL